METLGNIIHSVGAATGLIHDEPKPEAAPAPLSAGAAPAANSAAYSEWEKNQPKPAGILDTLKAALAPPPLDADPVEETVKPLTPGAVEESRTTKEKSSEAAPSAPSPPKTLLGRLLNTVEEKLEATLPLVEPSAPAQPEPVASNVLSKPAFVEEEEETAPETVYSKLEAEAADTKAVQSPTEATRDKGMAPLPLLDSEKKTITQESQIGDWEVEGGRVRHEEEKQGTLDEATAKAKKDASGVSQGQLNRVAKAADKLMSELAREREAEASGESSSAERRTSVAPIDEKDKDEFSDREMRVEAPNPAGFGFALEPPSAAIGKGRHVDAATEKKEGRLERERDDQSAVAPPAKTFDVEKLIKVVGEATKNLDESKLPPLTPEVAFGGAAQIHEPIHSKMDHEPKHPPSTRRVGRLTTSIQQPKHSS